MENTKEVRRRNAGMNKTRKCYHEEAFVPLSTFGLWLCALLSMVARTADSLLSLECEAFFIADK